MRLFKRKAVVKNQRRPLPLPLLTLLREAWWLLMAAFSAYLAIILYSYSLMDSSWSHSSSDTITQNYGGIVGAWVSDILLYTFGFSAWWFVILGILCIIWSWRHGKIDRLGIQLDSSTFITLLGFVILLAASCSLEYGLLAHKQLNLPQSPGGALGQVLQHFLFRSLGHSGSYLLSIVVFVIGLSLFTGLSWLNLTEGIGEKLENTIIFLWNRWQAYKDRSIGRKIAQERTEKVSTQKKRIEDQAPVRIEPPVLNVPISEKAHKPAQPSLFGNSEDGSLPNIALLDPRKTQQETVSAETIEYASGLIERKLAEFSVEVKVIAAYPGPVITRYEIEPAVGVKGAQIVNLMKDLARALSLVSIRVVETIPGKAYMGLELPNPKRQIVQLSEIIGSTQYQEMSSHLTMALGKDIAGLPVSADLAKMPHVLVAGTTGSGKSVAINAMILSVLYKATAKEVRLLMIDPKMLELSVYADIPHLLAPVVTDMRQAANALAWCVAEMERRYRLMSHLGVRNLAGYNQKIIESEKNGEPIPDPFNQNPENPISLTSLPMIVVVIDELADLMMVNGKKIEELIARLAQKARASGIHLILATQRPSVDVITGLIKANIPTRIAFQVSSKIDSRTILDQMGAEALLGQGDMLYLHPGTGYPTRIHGAFVSDAEVHRVVDFLKTIGQPNYIPDILSGSSDSGDEPSHQTDTEGDADPLYDEAVALVLKSRRASISSVQRHLRIGYNRAARLIEQMERDGLVSPMENNGNRTVLVPDRND